MSVPPEIDARWTSRLTLLVDEVEALRRQRRSGRRHRPHASSRRCVSRRREPGLVHRVDELRRRAEQRHAGRVGEVEQHVAVRMERRAVVEQQRRLGRERRHQPVPHHPAAGREVEDAIARLDVAVELVLLQVLDQRAAGAVDDALRDAGRARRIEDVERMVERKRSNLSPSRRAAPMNSLHSDGVAARCRAIGVLGDVGNDDQCARPSAAARTDLGELRADSRASCRRRSSRRPRRAPAARSGRTDRARPARRSPASTTTRPRRSPPRRARRRSLRACSADSRRRDRPAGCPPLAAPRQTPHVCA